LRRSKKSLLLEMRQHLSHLISLQNPLWMRLVEADRHASMVDELPTRPTTAQLLVPKATQQPPKLAPREIPRLAEKPFDELLSTPVEISPVRRSKSRPPQ